MTKKQIRRAQTAEFFEVPSIKTRIFRASDITRILRIEKWRLEKFLTGKQFRLSPSGHLGEGKGSWRLFNRQDLYRLAIATRLVEDGFTAKFASMVLQGIWDNELLDIDEHGENVIQNVGVVRSKDGPQVVLGGTSAEQRPYYMLPLRQIIKDVEQRIGKERS